MPNGSQINDEEINQMIASLKQNEAGTSNPIRGERVIAPPSRQPAPMMQPPMPPQPMSQPAAPMNQDNAPIASTSGITYSADPAPQQSAQQPAPTPQPVQNNAPAPQQPFQPAAPAPAKPEEKPVEKKEEKVGGDRYVFLDIETTGLDVNSDSIIEIGAISSVSAPLHFLVKIDKPVPETIVGITGITDSLLKSEGKDLRSCLKALISFTDGKILVGYNIGFDIKFLNHALSELGVGALNNRYIDLMKEAKRRNLFQNNYRFVTTLKEYGVNGEIQHRALEDAKLAHELFVRMGLGE